ncbi:hypothetical protein M8818_007840 [Zalaria obscura]|uniref:Uncharacterized protein n=1 Tax=Zalaria obscura TaxID=2024903 RepID=A0ACC3S6I6_9PEZI
MTVQERRQRVSADMHYPARALGPTAVMWGDGLARVAPAERGRSSHDFCPVVRCRLTTASSAPTQSHPKDEEVTINSIHRHPYPLTTNPLVDHDAAGYL